MDTSSNYEIQSSGWRDLFTLSALEKVCFDQDAWPLLELMGVLTFPGVMRLKAVGANQMVGFIAGDPRRSEKTGWILTLGVLPAWRRQGIGFALLSACEEQLAMPTIKLTVRRNNQAALHLYEKMGYSQVDIWSRYYRNGEDGLVLEKHL
jgi:ribosomal protein S18 acetylase RimI-like enzyme